MAVLWGSSHERFIEKNTKISEEHDGGGGGVDESLISQHHGLTELLLVLLGTNDHHLVRLRVDGGGDTLLLRQSTRRAKTYLGGHENVLEDSFRKILFNVLSDGSSLEADVLGGLVALFKFFRHCFDL